MRQRWEWLSSWLELPLVVFPDDAQGSLSHLFSLPVGERERRVRRLCDAVENGKCHEMPDEPWRFRAKCLSR